MIRPVLNLPADIKSKGGENETQISPFIQYPAINLLPVNEYSYKLIFFNRLMAPYIGQLPMPEDYRLQELSSLTRNFSASYLRL